MKTWLMKYVAVAALIVSVLASLFQFHTHDCGGHVRLGCNDHVFVLGCMHHDNTCADLNHADHKRTAGHDHSNNDCPLHLQSPVLISGRYHYDMTAAYDGLNTTAAPLTDTLFLTVGQNFQDATVVHQRLFHLTAAFLYTSPLRGSPVTV